MAMVMIMAVAMVRVPMPAQDDKDESIDQDPHQCQDEHDCTPDQKSGPAIFTCGRLRLTHDRCIACHVRRVSHATHDCQAQVAEGETT